MYVDRLNIRLKKLTLENFRGFRSMELSLDTEKNITVLIADNGLGKTTILDAIAGFLRYFRHEAIYSAHEKKEPCAFKGEFDPTRDVTNGTLISKGQATLEIEYPFLSAEVLDWVVQCINWLNETEASGDRASLIFDHEESEFSILIETTEPEEESLREVFYLLPDELSRPIEQARQNSERGNLAEFLDTELKGENVQLEFARKVNDQWELSSEFDPTFFSSTHKGEVELEFEMNSQRPDSCSFKLPGSRSANLKDRVEALKKGKAFVEDFRKVVGRRSPYDTNESTNLTLPLLAYYGGSAINTNFDKRLKLPYQTGWFQPYAHALEPKRFDFAEFFSWALWTEEKAPHQWYFLKKAILEVINPPGEDTIYTDLKIEEQQLVVLKNIADGKNVGPEEPQKVKLPQLSSGEKNILALVADLVKRAIQLNPHLVPALEFEEGEDKDSAKKVNGKVQFETPIPGLVLIDEIDLHLHPKWQRGIVPKLAELFPGVQFVVTTHSPYVLQNIENEKATVVIIKGFNISKLGNDGRFYGRDILHILYTLMGVSMKRPKEVQNMINKIYNMLEQENLDLAEQKLEELRELLTESDGEVIQLQTLIEFKRL